MNFIEMIEFLLKFFLVDMIENSILIMFTLLFMRKQLNMKVFVIMVFLTSIFVQFVYPAQETIIAYLINRLLVFSFIDIVILIYYELKLKNFLHTFKYIVLSMCVIIVLESVSILPFVYFLDLDMDVVRRSIYTLLILSFPTRMIEYSALYLYYDRRKQKDEKVYRANQENYGQAKKH